MRIEFDIAGQPAVLLWNNVTGQTELEAAGQTHVLQRMANPLSHFSLSPLCEEDQWQPRLPNTRS